MPTISQQVPILDSSGQRANGFVRVSASRPFDTAQGHITTAWAAALVKDGIATMNGAPWYLPPTPEGVFLQLEQELDGEQTIKFRVYVPDQEYITYSELLSNRAGIALGWGYYAWDLSGEADFPPEALIGDLGYDSVSGDLWRNDA
ncbi:hypothetical protein [Microbacterium lacus]|uniref:hypothetical protein n=1 Tax=Microbacterium lacus TaxID=415217 RepID=UPI0012FDAB7D|nr:hypothetical protein [Microbacterium lacus]